LREISRVGSASCVRLHLNKTGSGNGRGDVINVKRFVLACVAVYVVYPITIGLAHAWFVATVVIAMICGLILALVYKPVEA
jgi:hypothetical protein